MKTKPFIFSLGASLLLITIIVPAIPKYHQRSEARKAVQALAALPAPRVFDAIESYRGDRSAKSGTVPETVSLSALLAGGYLQTNEVASLVGLSVIFSTTNVDEMHPAETRARVLLSSGGSVVMLGDGSISTHR